MTVSELMERSGMNGTGRAIAYIKEALEEINMHAETHVKVAKQDIIKDQRFYNLPFDAIKIIAIRCKNQNNSEDLYQNIPRSIYPPARGDSDGI